MSHDIGPILDGWEYRPDRPVVRRITGSDGRPKLQLRVDLGLLQMELSGRPDSRRPHGHETLLSYYHHLRDAHEERHGNTDDFVLDADDCMKLQLESVQFYH
ncbi:MAG: hypothetical protein QGH20_01005, partial [Candidatus Latescibacteria bacterium]|nr:hypothetical protein [Candidatus Latescibacterota bacterium]